MKTGHFQSRLQIWKVMLSPLPPKIKTGHFQLRLQIWKVMLSPLPPKMKTDHFQSRLQICKVTLHRRGNLKVYHLLSSSFLNVTAETKLVLLVTLDCGELVKNPTGLLIKAQKGDHLKSKARGYQIRVCDGWQKGNFCKSMKKNLPSRQVHRCIVQFLLLAAVLHNYVLRKEYWNHLHLDLKKIIKLC